jgi:hypothetical protein
MANTLKIKRGSGTPTTSNLAQYELAYDYTNDKLYIHDPTNSAGQEIVELTGLGQDTINNTNWSGTDLSILNGGTGASTAAAARTNLGVDAAGTDNSTNVTIAAGKDYITINESTQVITLGSVDVTTDITGALPITNGGTGATLAQNARSNLGLAIGSDVQAYDDLLQDIANLSPGLSENGYVVSYDDASGNLVLSAQSGGISFNGSTADGLVTYGNSSTADVEQYLTFNGSHLKLLIDGGKFIAGADEDFSFYHSGTHGWIDNLTGNLYIRNQTDDGQILIQTDDGTGGTTTYISVKGNEGLTRFLKSTRHNDGVIAQFGTGADLKIQHDGSNSWIYNDVTGNLYIENRVDDGALVFRGDNGSGGLENYLTIDGNAQNLNFNSKALVGIGGIYGTSNTLNMYANTYYFKNSSGTILGSLNGSTLDIPNTGDWSYILNNTNSGGLRLGTKDAGGTLAYQIELSNTGNYVKLNENTTITGTATVTSSITTGYGVAYTNGATNFLHYNNTGENVLYLRDTTNSAMVQTWGVNSVQIHKGLTINEDGGAYDTRIEGDTDTHLFFADASEDRVGIGVSSPVAKLDVTGSSSGGSYSLQLRSGDSSTSTDAAQIIFSYAGSPYNSSGYAHSIRTRHNAGGTTGNAIDFWLWDQATDAASTLGTKRVMTVDGGGRVGINDSSPTHSLDTTGTINATSAYYLNGSQVINSSGNWVGGGNISEFTNDSGYLTSSSTINAATLDGIDSSQFLRSDVDDQSTGILTVDTLKITNDASDTSRHRVAVFDSGSTSYGMMLWNTSGTTGDWATMIYGPYQSNRRISFGKVNNATFADHGDVSEIAYFDLDDSTLRLTADAYVNSNKIWHAGNDGSGTGLDADLLDGNHASAFVRSNFRLSTNASSDANSASTSGIYRVDSGESNIPGGITYGTLVTFNNLADTGFQIIADYHAGGGSLYWRGGNSSTFSGTGSNTSWFKIWNEDNDGSGSTLDADLLDGVQGASYLRSDADDTMEESLYMNASDSSEKLYFQWQGTTIGDIGGSDTTWLRINQATAKNIYTPRYIRADGGFFVDGSSQGITGDGILRVPNGSAGTPSMSFAADTDSGMYLVSGDQLGFSAGGSARLVLNSSGPNFINGSGLYMDYRKFFELTSNSNDRGVWNPIVSSIRNSGIQIHPDEEFAEGSNNVNLYNNAGGTNLVVSRITASTDSLVPPNKTGQVIKVAYNGNGTVSPNYGGIYQNITSEENHTFVQIFQAKLPDGRYFVINENPQGTNNTSYWLTENTGTGKWEWYARVSHCGDSGTFSSGGHISVAGGTDTAFNWYIASMTLYDVTESPYNYTTAGKGTNGQILKADGDGTYSWQSQGSGWGLDADTLDGQHASAFLTTSGTAANSTLLNNLGSGSFLRSDANDDFSGTLNYTPDTGTILSVDGQAILQRMTAGGAITIGHDDAVIIAGGDTSTTLNTNINNATETVFIGAEGGLTVYAFPNNDTSWANRKELSYNGSTLNLTGNITLSGTVDGRDVASDGSKLDGIESGATADQTKSDIDALGINAATLDSIDSSQFLRSDTNDSMTGNLTVSGTVFASTLQTDSGNLNLSGGGWGMNFYIDTDANSSDNYNFYSDNALRHILGGDGNVTFGKTSNPTLSIMNTATAAGSGPTLEFGHDQAGGLRAAALKTYLTDGSTTNRTALLRLHHTHANADVLKLQLGDNYVRQYQKGDTSDYLETIVNDDHVDFHVAHGNYVKITTDSGNVGIGPRNTSWCHFYTDRPGYYFDKGPTAGDGIFQSYSNLDLHLRRSQGTDDRITIEADQHSHYVNGSKRLEVKSTGIVAQGNSQASTYFQCNQNGATLKRYVSSWTNATTHDVVLNGYQTTLGDYVYLKASGNSTTTHGIIVASDNYIFMGRDNLTEGAIDNSATAPITDCNFRLDSTGNALFDGDVVAYSTTIASDARLKENVEDLNYGLKDVLNIRPVSFDWKDKRNGQHDIGVIAQEIEKIIPEVVVEVDTLNSEDTHKTVDYAKLTSVLIKAIQEQQQQINELKEQLNG